MTFCLYLFIAYLIACEDVARLERMCAKGIAEIGDLRDQIEEERMVFAEHRANHVCVEKESEWPEIVL